MKAKVETIKMASLKLTLCVVVCCAVSALGHVALTFPPARRYDLDFLDNVRTKPPCGMPKGKKLSNVQ